MLMSVGAGVMFEKAESFPMALLKMINISRHKMGATIGITLVTCIGLMASVLVKPSVDVKHHSFSIYWIVVLFGAVLLMCTGRISLQEVAAGLSTDSAVNPIKILVLFFSMSVLSIFLDEVGFFRYLASYTLMHARASQKSLFIYLYVIVSFLTVFTSNDIIILTFTPFICYFAKNAKIDPTPYLFAEFVAANTWSMMFIIGNPTNIYLATANGIDFVDYFLTMGFPTFCCGVTAFFILYMIFRKKLSEKLSTDFTEEKITDRKLLTIGLVHLASCTVMLVISAYIEVEMWLITLAFALSLFLFDRSYRLMSHTKGDELKNCLKRVPWELIPFIISMFVIVLSLDKYNITGILSEFLESRYAVFTYGGASFLTANLINNIPMSVLFCPVISGASEAIREGAVYAAVVGSNLGAILTPVGALAAIMWSNILKTNKVKFNFGMYVKYGAIVSIPSIIVTLLVLYVTL